MLDDLKLISKIDKSGMLDTIAQFPEQIKDALKIMETIDIPDFIKLDNVIISGMGGSAISGDIVRDELIELFEIKK